jgi:uncharacterized protein YkwD
MKILFNQTLTFVFCISLIHHTSAQCPPSKQTNIHVVQKGETLFGISKKYKVAVTEICAWNDRNQSDPLPVCTNLWVKAPQKSASAAKSNVPKSYSQVPTKKKPAATSYDIPQRSAKGTHIVQEGETIADIARYYGYTEERFREFNLLSGGQEVEVGTVLLSTDCTCMQGTTSDAETTTMTGNTETVPTSYENNDNFNTQPQNDTPPQLKDAFEDSETVVNNKSTTVTPKSANPATAASTSGAPVLRKTLSAPYMRDEELTMTDEINLMRSNPKGYIKYIEEYIAEMRRDGEFGNSIQTAYELIDELKRTPQLSVLEPMQCLYNAARKHGEDQRPTGDVNHQGRDGSWPWDRVVRECPQLKDGNENIVGGPSSVRKSVILLLVDDGIPNRGHRKTLLNPDWKYNACYKVGTVGDMPNCWVQKFGF